MIDQWKDPYSGPVSQHPRLQYPYSLSLMIPSSSRWTTSLRLDLPTLLLLPLLQSSFQTHQRPDQSATACHLSDPQQAPPRHLQQPYQLRSERRQLGCGSDEAGEFRSGEDFVAFEQSAEEDESRGGGREGEGGRGGWRRTVAEGFVHGRKEGFQVWR